MFQLKRFLPYYKYLKPVWWQFALGIFFGVLFSVSSGLGLPIMAETVFPVLFGSPEVAPEWLRAIVERWFADDIQGGFLILCCLFLPLVMILRACGAIGNGYFMTYAGIHVVQAIRRAVFAKVQSLPLAFFHRYKTGQIIAGINGYPNRIKQVVVDTSNDLVKQPLTLMSAVGFLIYKSFTSDSFFISVVAIFSVPLIVFPIRRIGHYLAKRSKQLVQMGEAINSSTIESVQSPVEIRTYNLQSAQKERFAKQLEEIFKFSMKTVRARLLISPSIELVAACGLSVSLFYGVRAGLSQGEFMALAVALYMAYGPVKKLGAIHGMLKSLEAPLQRLEDILQAPENLPESESPVLLPKKVRGDLVFNSVSFSYPAATDVAVLENVNVRISAGESVGLVGESGAGKSTFVNLIPRLFDPISGSIRLDGIDLRDVSLDSLRAQSSYVPQMPMLFNASVADNIRVGKADASDPELVQAAKQANALEFIESLPNGFETILSERGNSLSGGQRQRIAIARAFLKDAPILILDEATSALDNHSDQLIQEALVRLAQDRTTLIIAHRMGTLKDVARRLYFEKGRLAGDGSHAHLIEANSGYAQLVHSESVAS